MTGPVLAVIGVHKTLGRRRVLEGVDLQVPQGRIVGLLGPNGAGKSTLLHVAIGLLGADRGRVELAGEDVTAAPLHARCGRGVGFLPQDGTSFDELSVADNVRGLLECSLRDRRAVTARLGEILAEVELSAFAHQEYGTLSGGERRRVEIAKALVRRPRLLLLDEPFAALDPRAVEIVARLLRRLAAGGIGILLADHRFESVLALADAVAVLHGGRIVAAGPPAAVRESPLARAAYFPAAEAPPPGGS